MLREGHRKIRTEEVAVNEMEWENVVVELLENADKICGIREMMVVPNQSYVAMPASEVGADQNYDNHGYYRVELSCTLVGYAKVAAVHEEGQLGCLDLSKRRCSEVASAMQ